MTREISLWGVGPSIAAAAGVYATLAGVATWLYPEFCLISAVPFPVFLVAGVALIAVGLPLLAVAAKAATAAYNANALATTGIFGVVRNPIYCAWIVFLIPGIVLLTRSWPLLVTPLVAYVTFKATIGRESDYLERHFGEAYRKYKTEVNELFPVPRRKRRLP